MSNPCHWLVRAEPGPTQSPSRGWDEGREAADMVLKRAASSTRACHDAVLGTERRITEQVPAVGQL